MKKIFALFLIVVMAMSMTACCACDCKEQIAALREEINSLKSNIPDENVPEETIPDETISEETIPEETISEETIPEETIPDETVSDEITSASTVSQTEWNDFITKQIETGDPANLLEVAKCDYANEDHLIEVSKRCASLEYYYYTSDNKNAQVKIANALSENEATTDRVMFELVKSVYPEVVSIAHQWFTKTIRTGYTPATWNDFITKQIETGDPANLLEVAKCDYANEDHLIEVSKRCASLEYYYYTSDNKNAQVKIANALSENEATTDRVMAELVKSEYFEVLNIVASSKKSGKEALIAVAKTCVSKKYYHYTSDNKNAQVKIANALSENEATTDRVMAELVKSEYFEVLNIVASSKKSGKEALLAVAKTCVIKNYYYYTSDNKNAQVKIANALAGNEATTPSIMSELVKSVYPEVVSIAHQWIESKM